MSGELPSRLMGRCSNGGERDGGSIFHAVAPDAWDAVCGKAPGRRSAGWSAHLGSEVNCKRCLAILNRRTNGDPNAS